MFQVSRMVFLSLTHSMSRRLRHPLETLKDEVMLVGKDADDTLFTAPTVPYSTAQCGGAYSLDPNRARIRTASTQVSVSAKSVTSSFQWRSAAASL